MARLARKPVGTMSREEHEMQYLAHRVRYLPEQIAATKRKLAALQTEAARYGLVELLEVQPHG